jgi:hypothetical protein
VQEELQAAAVDFKKKFPVAEEPGGKSGGQPARPKGGSSGSGSEEEGIPASGSEEDVEMASADELDVAKRSEGEQGGKEEEVGLDEVAQGALGKLMQRRKR